MKTVIKLTLCVCLMLYAAPLPAAMRAVNTATLTDESDDVVTGQVVNIKSHWNDKKTMIFTDVTVKVDSALKGDLAGQEITITVPGGIVGSKFKIVSTAPVFKNGEEVFLFLHADEITPVQKVVTEHVQGKFTIVTDPQTSKKFAVRGAGVLVNAKGAVIEETNNRILLDNLIKQVQTAIENENKN